MQVRNSLATAYNILLLLQYLLCWVVICWLQNAGEVHVFWEGHKNFCEISILLLSHVQNQVVPVKSKLEISQNFVAFSEYMNFTVFYVVVAKNFSIFEDTRHSSKCNYISWSQQNLALVVVFLGAPFKLPVAKNLVNCNVLHQFFCDQIFSERPVIGNWCKFIYLRTSPIEMTDPYLSWFQHVLHFHPSLNFNWSSDFSKGLALKSQSESGFVLNFDIACLDSCSAWKYWSFKRANNELSILALFSLASNDVKIHSWYW